MASVCTAAQRDMRVSVRVITHVATSSTQTVHDISVCIFILSVRNVRKSQIGKHYTKNSSAGGGFYLIFCFRFLTYNNIYTVIEVSETGVN
jgi:hypothetical protein